MNKQEFVDKLAVTAGLSRGDAAKVVDAFVEGITESLARGEEVRFTGFGKFTTQTRAARMGVNPRTMAATPIAAQRVPKFTPGSLLKKAIR